METETIEVIFNLEQSRYIFKKYFDYETRQAFKKFPYLIYYGVSMAFVLIGEIFVVDFWSYLGLSVFVLLSVFLLYHFLKRKIIASVFLKSLEKKIIEPEQKFIFSFSEEGMIRESENFNQKVNWALIDCFVENNGDVYLFFKNGELHDIISESILGKEKFEKFKSIISQKSKMRD